MALCKSRSVLKAIQGCALCTYSYICKWYHMYIIYNNGIRKAKERNIRTKGIPYNLYAFCLCCCYFIEWAKWYISKNIGILVTFSCNRISLCCSELNCFIIIKRKLLHFNFGIIMVFFTRNNIWFLKSIVQKTFFLAFKWNGN